MLGIWNPQSKPAVVRMGSFAEAEDTADDMADRGAKAIIDKWVPDRKCWLSIQFVGYGDNTPWARKQAGRFKSQKGQMINAESILEQMRAQDSKEVAKLRTAAAAERVRDRETENLIRRAQASSRKVDTARDIAVQAAGPKAAKPGGGSARGRFRGQAGAHPFHN
ncbi:hypothetical protein OHR86_28010 [Streptomyces sp. NBC_00441]|uniref:hypothetical protein n=1 Tax=Streptomyces sp. NBC_00441 TaxID=2975742 RepID=UPI002E2C0BA7|nr:hypothetical protein [Streptomyces sp. NBC_00441]